MTQRQISGLLLAAALFLFGRLSAAAPPPGQLFPPTIHGTSHARVGQVITLDFTYKNPNWAIDPGHLWYTAEAWACAPGYSEPPPQGEFDVNISTEGWGGALGPSCKASERVRQPIEGAHPHQSQGQTTARLMGGVWGETPGRGVFYYRIRLGTSDPQVVGPWGPWFLMTIGPLHFKDAPIRRPEIIGPAEGRLFVNQDLPLQLKSDIHHNDYANWEFELQWQRAGYHTKANNDAYTVAHGAPAKNGWPRVLGITDPMKPWGDSAVPAEVAQGAGVQTLSVPYAALRSHDAFSSFEYRVRAREHRLNPDTYGTWTAWRSFIVQEPYPYTERPLSNAALQPLGQLQKAQASQLHGSQGQGGFAPRETAPAMHARSGSLAGGFAPPTPGTTGLHNPRPMPLPPRVRVIQEDETVDYSCAHLANLITVHEALYNDGGTLAADHAKVYVKEDGGAHIQSAAVVVPPLAHDARTWVTIVAGTQLANAGQLPGVHHIPVYLAVDGKRVASFLTLSFNPGTCKPPGLRVAPLPRLRAKPALQPAPQAAPAREALPRLKLPER